MRDPLNFMKEYKFYVYIMASASGTLYIGMTNSIIRRVNEHRAALGSNFTAKYSCYKLVYYERFDYVYNALDREKELKSWRREKKQNLIKKFNAPWRDLSDELFAEG